MKLTELAESLHCSHSFGCLTFFFSSWTKKNETLYIIIIFRPATFKWTIECQNNIMWNEWKGGRNSWKWKEEKKKWWEYEDILFGDETMNG